MNPKHEKLVETLDWCVSLKKLTVSVQVDRSKIVNYDRETSLSLFEKIF